MSATANLSLCSALRARARQRCCESSRDWSFRTSGTIFLNGEDASLRSASERSVGFVFQHYALFRHMTVFENVAFGLRVRPEELAAFQQRKSMRRSWHS